MPLIKQRISFSTIKVSRFLLWQAILTTYVAAFQGKHHFSLIISDFDFRYNESELTKLDIRINGDPVEPLATIVHKDKVILSYFFYYYNYWFYSSIFRVS